MKNNQIIWKVQVNRFLLLLFVMATLASITPANAAGENAFEDMEIAISPLPHKVAVGFPYDIGDDYYFVKSISRIFFQTVPLTAKVVDVDIDDDTMELTLEDKKYGKGVIKFFSVKDLEDVPEDELKTVVSRSLSDPNLAMVVVDSETQIFHMPSCNHLPIIKNRIHMPKDTAFKVGNKPCGVCFAEVQYLPESGLELELQNKLAAEQRYINAPLLDPKMQDRVEIIGKKVLSNWPYPRLGYHYKFTVVETNRINAVALPAGAIFVTSGLINAVENDDELEAVLAHEIAHVERRHSLNTYKRLVATQQAQAAMAVVGGAVAGAAAARGHGTTATVATGITALSMVGLNLYNLGYSRKQEREADDLAFRYFAKTSKNTAPLKAIFKKLMYHNLCLQQNPDPTTLTHPSLSNRISLLENRRTIFPEGVVYHTTQGGQPFEIQLVSLTELKNEVEATFTVSDLGGFRQFMKGGGAIRVMNGAKDYEYILEEEEEDVYTDPWGGLVKTKGKALGMEFQSITGMEVQNFEKDPTFGYPIAKKWKLTKGKYY